MPPAMPPIAWAAMNRPYSWLLPCSTCRKNGANSVPTMPSPTLVIRPKIISARSSR